MKVLVLTLALILLPMVGMAQLEQEVTPNDIAAGCVRAIAEVGLAFPVNDRVPVNYYMNIGKACGNYIALAIVAEGIPATPDAVMAYIGYVLSEYLLEQIPEYQEVLHVGP